MGRLHAGSAGQPRMKSGTGWSRQLRWCLLAGWGLCLCAAGEKVEAFLIGTFHTAHFSRWCHRLNLEFFHHCYAHKIKKMHQLSNEKYEVSSTLFLKTQPTNLKAAYVKQWKEGQRSRTILFSNRCFNRPYFFQVNGQFWTQCKAWCWITIYWRQKDLSK